METEPAFYQRAERLAANWRRRYGVSDDGAWTDEQIERALADHGLPALANLPGEARGMMRSMADSSDTSPEAAQQWRRVNAMHLIGHVMLHGGERCDGCRDWGEADV